MALVYNPTIFEHIPSLEVTHQTGSLNKNFSEFLTQFFLVAAEFGLLDSYGVTLVHRHTKIDQGQRLMDFKQTLQPFPLDDTAQELGGCPIRPKSLALVSGTWNPYEYELGDVEPLDDSFLTEVEKLINRFDICHVGLRRYSPEDPEELEVTERGGISVKMPLRLAPETGQDFKTTFWARHSGQPKTYKCHCRDTGSSINPNHNHIDS